LKRRRGPKAIAWRREAEFELGQKSTEMMEKR